MGRWLLFLGGPLIWAAHFGLIYAIASLSVVAAGETTAAARVAIGASGLGAALACAVLAWRALKAGAQDELGRFMRMVGGVGAIIGLIAVIWQTLPALALP